MTEQSDHMNANPAVASMRVGTHQQQEPDVNKDRELFARFLAGDDRAFLELFDRHTARLGRYCRKMIGNSSVVEDLLQDLWEKVLRLRDQNRGVPPNPLGVLYWMTRNICLNHRRDQRSHASLDNLGETGQPKTRITEQSQLEELVVIALEQLPMDQREVLILNAYSGYTFEEIALMMDQTHGAVRTRAWRARRVLKRTITRMMDDDDSDQLTHTSEE